MLDLQIDKKIAEKNEKINICVLGGGNIGTLLLADLGQNEKVSVRLFTSKCNQWKSQVIVYDSKDTFMYSGKVDTISDKPEDVIEDADIIISTLPSHIFPEIFDRIYSSIKPGTWIGMMPGSGGNEFYVNKLIREGCILFGFQRVHGISRIKVYGESVYDLGKKTELFIGSIPSGLSSQIASTLEMLLGIKCYPLKNYLNVTLTPSNPILHTSRLYSLFKEYNSNCYWDKEIEFYSEWTDDASNILIECDNELQLMCKSIKELDLSDVKSLKEHYGVSTLEEMTEKIKSIKAFKGIKAPMVRENKGYIPDFGSRYFQEDFPYGLCIIKSFCNVVGLSTPSIDKILKWYESINGVEYFKNGEFAGRDIRNLPLPQNYAINSIKDIVEFYGR